MLSSGAARPQHLAVEVARYGSGSDAMSPSHTGGEPLWLTSLQRRCDKVLKRIFSWWNGATIGTLFTIMKRGVFVGEDETGNRYFEAKDNKDSYDARKRRWVIYSGYAEPSKIPPDWHGWMHYTFDDPPTTAPLLRRSWEKDHQPNLTGTVNAWRPRGSIARGGERASATGDYQAWTPD